MKKSEKYIYLILIVILVGVLAGGITYMAMKDNDNNNNANNAEKEDNNTNKEDNINNENEEIPKYELSYFEEYLKPFKFAISNYYYNAIEDYWNFITMYYIFNSPNELVCDYDNLGSEQFSCNTLIPKKSVNELLDKYFGRKDIDLTSIKDSDFAKIEESGDNYILKFGATDWITTEKILSYEYKNNKVFVNYELSFCPNGEDEECYDKKTKTIELEYKDNRFIVKKITVVKKSE